jgi:hypothetical protein
MTDLKRRHFLQSAVLFAGRMSRLVNVGRLASRPGRFANIQIAI